MMIAEVPMIVVYNGPEIAAYDKKVQGYAPWPLQPAAVLGRETGGIIQTGGTGRCCDS